MKRNFLVALILALSSTACLRSLHGLYTDKDLVFEPGLVGEWHEEGEKSSWTFVRDGQKRYELVYRQHMKGGTLPDSADLMIPATFEAHLVRLGPHLFLDLFPKDVVSRNDLFAIHVVPAHTFSRVELSGKTMTLAMLDHEWFKRKTDDGTLSLSYEEVEKGQYVLTAKTAELQKLVRSYANDAEAFPEPTELKKTK